MHNPTLQQWKYILLSIIVLDLVIAGGIFYFIIEPSPSIALTSSITPPPLIATVMVTPTPWAGPGRHPNPTATLPPTPTATNALALGGFPVGFTPTPRPTREPVFISLPFLGNRGGREMPVINQIYYPEPFFPPGTNNACGPIALYAGFKGLKLDVDYNRLRDIAVTNGFDAHGISTSGLLNTAITLNDELNQPLSIDYGKKYRTNDLIKQLRQKAVIIILIRVKREAGVFQMTDDYSHSFGHFLLIDQINIKSRYVSVAGSTLGMDRVPLEDFTRAWSGQTPPAEPLGWASFLQQEQADNWALILKKAK